MIPLMDEQPRHSTTLALSNGEDQPPVILVAHASVGSGHKLAAQAIAEAFQTLKDSLDIPANTQVELVDILEFGRIKFNGDRWAHLFTGVTRPWYDFVWRYLFTGRLLWGGGWSWSRIMFPRYTEFIRQKKPLAVICTHITAANATVGARIITKQDFPLVCVPTDYETEGWWPHRAADLFCVGTESMAETLRPRKVEEERIAITGIPTRPAFSLDYNKEEVREKYCLPQDKAVILALAGSIMASPYALFRDALDQVIPYMHVLPHIHLLFCAGNDEEYHRHLMRQIEDLGLKNVSAIGYTEDMAAIMSSCDAVVCKAGGLVTTEALCTQTPIILLGRAYGQEYMNVRMLTSRGAAMHVTTGRELLEVFRILQTNPEHLDALVLNESTLRKPDAAQQVVEATIDLISGQKPVDPATRKSYFAHFYLGHKPAHTR